MGKIRKLRQKCHSNVQKSQSLNNLPEDDSIMETTPSTGNFFNSSENIFAGIDISYDKLTKTLPDHLYAASVVSTKSRKELKEEERHLTKKEKQKLRHERFMKKLERGKQVMQNEKKMKTKKQETGLAGDMSSLLEALPSLPPPSADSSNKKLEKPKTKRKGVLKVKQRLKQQVADLKFMRKILQETNYRMISLVALNRELSTILEEQNWV